MKKIYYIFFFIIFASVPLAAQSWKELIDQSDKALSLRNYKEAMKYAEQSLDAAAKEFGKKSEFYSQSLGTIGEIYFLQGNYQKAIDYFLQEKDIKKEVLGNQSPGYATVINNLSVAYQKTARFTEAERLLLEALEIKKETVRENDTSYAKSLNNLGQLYQTLGEYSKAENLLVQALAIKESRLGKENLSYANSILNLGILHKNLNNKEKAEKEISKAIEIYKNNYGEQSSEVVNAEYQLALAYLSSGENSKAEPLLHNIQEKQKKLKGTNDLDYMNTLYNLAMIKWSLGQLDEAETLLSEDFKIVEARLGNAHPLYSSCLNSLGVINRQKGNYDKALEELTKAVFLRERIYPKYHPDYATSVHNLAGLLKDMGRYDEADKYYNKVLELYQGQIKNYFPFLSDNEKNKFYANLKDRFDIFYCYVLSRKDDNPSLISDMYNCQLSIKSILLKSSVRLREKMLESNNPDLIRLFDNWKIVREELARLYSKNSVEVRRTGLNIDSLESIANELEKRISRESSDFSQSEMKTIRWQDIRSALKPDEAAVEIIRFNFFNGGWRDTTFYAALVLRSDYQNPALVLFQNGRELENLYIKNYKNSISFKLPDNDSYKAFWSKIDEKLQGIKTVYISKDGVYNKVNISTLMKQDESYVFDSQSIINLSNTAQIVSLKSNHKNNINSNLSAFLFGNPDFYSSQTKTPQETGNNLKYTITELPGTKAEIEEISNLLKEKNYTVNIFTEQKATKNNLLSVKKADLIHIATHGFFMSDINSNSEEKIYGIDIDKAVDEPLLRSGLFFAGTGNVFDTSSIYLNAERGILTAYEAMDMDLLKTRLVVLSACETGLGEIRNGEGVYGLQRAFLIAGAQNILMSLWKVDDEATQALMKDFYTNWLNGESLQNSLKLAQEDIRAKYKHPYYWGAFVLVGN